MGNPEKVQGQMSGNPELTSVAKGLPGKSGFDWISAEKL